MDSQVCTTSKTPPSVEGGTKSQFLDRKEQQHEHDQGQNDEEASEMPVDDEEDDPFEIPFCVTVSCALNPTKVPPRATYVSRQLTVCG